MNSTQSHLNIEDIRDDLVILKDGSVSLVLSTGAVNFGLLSEEEQASIIYSFAGLLNSLSFAIQIVVRSERLDVSSYLKTLDQALKATTNPHLAQMGASYREFVQSVIKNNEVLDKQFYICLSVTNVEIGLLTKGGQNKVKKAQIVLAPRKDHLIRQLSRLGLKSRSLTTAELIRLFYDIYNGVQTAENGKGNEARLVRGEPVSIPHPTITDRPAQPAGGQSGPAAPPPVALPPSSYHVPLTPPFVVEELTDDYGP